MFCVKCGKQNDDNSWFCTGCGMELAPTNQMQESQTAQSGQTLQESQTVQSGQALQESQTVQSGQALQESQTVQSGQTLQESQTVQSGQTLQESQTVQSGQILQEQQQSMYYQQPIEPSGKKSKKGLIIALVIVGLLAVAGVATAGGLIVKSLIAESSDDSKSKSDSDSGKVDKDDDSESVNANKEEQKKKEEEEKKKEEAKKEEEETKKKEEEAKKKAAEDKIINAKAHRAYGDIIIAYQYANEEYCGITTYDFHEGYDTRISDEYAIYDIDSDGIDELLIFSENTYMANMQLNIFYYDSQNDKAVCIDTPVSPIVAFYDNGIIRADDLHNQTYSEFWPYSLYKYDSDNKSLIYLAGIYAWEKEFSQTSYDGGNFPDDIDADGNGCVYCITTDGNSQYMDDSDYEKWLSSQINNADTVSINTNQISESYGDSNIKGDYMDYLVSNVEKICGDNNDLGLAYLKCKFEDSSMNFISMTQSFVTYTSMDEYDMEYSGMINGVTAVDYYSEDGGTVIYTQAVDGVTLFGIKPGDKVDDAKMKLKSAGFYDAENAYRDNCFINGIHTASYAVSFEESNGIITKVSISFYSRFVS